MSSNPPYKSPQIGKVKNRILFLSPSVQNCLERECNKDDFFSEGDRPLGKGGFGQVWKVRNKLTNKVYAIKVISKKNIIEQKMVEQMNREIEIMYKLHHSYIVKLVNHYEDDDNLYLIMNLASKGQLYSILKKTGKFDQRTAAQYMRELICALKYLHTQFDPPIIHRDIKPENILIDEFGKVKLADFGWSNYEKDESKRTTYCGTPEYLAPEMVKKEGHDTSVDIWYCGILLFELLIGYTPFAGVNQTELFNNIKKHRINWPEDFPSLAKNLISKILKQNPKERPSLDEILAHPWFENNPPLRPIVNDEITDPKAILESHLINVVPEAVSVPLSQVGRPSRLKDTPSTSNNSSNSYKNTNQDNNQSNIIYPKQIENDKLSKDLEEKNLLIEKLERIIQEFKGKLEKSESENKTLRNENAKIQSAKTLMEADIAKLKEDNERHKIVNKDRLLMLTEIEEKSNELIELRNKLKFNSNEIESIKQNYKTLEEKYNNSLKFNEITEMKNSEFKIEIENLIKDRENLISQNQKKIKVLEAKFFDKNPEETGPSIEALLSMVKDSIDDLKQFFKLKTDKLERLIREERDEASNCESKIKELIYERSFGVKEMIDNLKNSFSNDLIKIKAKLENENNSKINERTNWLKNQISELMPFKNKFLNLEMENEKLKKINSITNEKYLNIENLNKLKDGVDSENKNQLKSKNNYISSLESKLSELKDFVFRHCPDKLEEIAKFKI